MSKNLALQTFFIIIAALLILLPQLPFYPLLPPDEARYVEIPREMVENNDIIVPRLNGVIYLEKPPLFYWLQTLPIKLFGIHEITLRFWNAFFAAFTCGLIFLAGSLYYNNRKVGFLAASMLFSSLLFYTMAHFISLDMTMSAFITGCLFSLLIGFNTPIGHKRRYWFYLAYVFAALAVLTKGLIGFMLPGAVVFSWLLFTNRWRELLHAYIPTGLIIFLAITLPWHILVQLRVPEFFDFYIIGQHFTRYLTLAEERYEPIWFFIPILLIGLLPWLPWVIYSIYKQCKYIKQELFLFLWVIIIFAFFSISKSKLIPYILPVLPPLFLMTAKHLIEQRSKLYGKLGVFIASASMITFAIATPIWVNYADRSIKPLVVHAKSLNYDEVVAFGRYYQDIPVYFEHTITLVGGLNELRFGTTLEDHSDQYPEHPAFWARWNNPQHRMIVFLSRNRYDNFLRESEVIPYTLGQTSYVMAIINWDPNKP